MTLPSRIIHEFVDLVPAEREEGKVYISIPYSTAVHNCLCDCGMKVVTPIKPNKWVLTYNGEAISLSPSIGNWNFPCKSHYWIEENRVIECGLMSQTAIDRGRAWDAVLTSRYHGQPAHIPPSNVQTPTPQVARKRSLWDKIFGNSQ